MREPATESGYDALAGEYSRALTHLRRDITDALLALDHSMRSLPTRR
jgi:hypothetical protein